MVKKWNEQALARGIAKRDGFSYAKADQEVHDLVKEKKVKLGGKAKSAARKLKKKKHKKSSGK